VLGKITGLFPQDALWVNDRAAVSPKITVPVRMTVSMRISLVLDLNIFGIVILGSGSSDLNHGLALFEV
jgi:hypothetical protein